MQAVGGRPRREGDHSTMTKKQIERFVRAQVLPDLNRFTSEGDLLVAPGDDLVLRGFVFDRSQLDKHAFDLHALVQPLYVPETGIRLGLSLWLGAFRVKDGAEDQVGGHVRATIESDGLPHLRRLGDYRGIAEALPEVARYKMNHDKAGEHRGYAFLLAGDEPRARQSLDEALALARERGASSEVAQRVERILELFAGSPEPARDQLSEWARQTAEALRLPTGSHHP